MIKVAQKKKPACCRIELELFRTKTFLTVEEAHWPSSDTGYSLEIIHENQRRYDANGLSRKKLSETDWVIQAEF